MNWKIEVDKNDTKKIRLITAPDSIAADLFFSGIRPSNYPDLIRSILEGVGYNADFVGVTLPDDADEYERINGGAVPEGMVEVYHHDFGGFELDEKTFLSMLYEYSSVLINELDDPDVNKKGWKDLMSAAVNKLETKIKTI